jgi:malonyl-CoA O-methyltransferase
MRIDKSRLALHFGKRALSYDRVTPVQSEMARELVAGVVARLGGRRPGSILELGCGTGRMTTELMRNFPGARVTALDIAPEMVDLARARVPGAAFVVADAEDYLAEIVGSFDLIISNATAQWFVDARATLARARALLAPGGLLAVATFGADTFMELDDAFRNAYARAGEPAGDHVVPLPSASAWRDCLPGAEMIETRLPRVFPDVRAFLRSVQEAGATNAQDGHHVLSRNILRGMTDWYASHYEAPSGVGIVATYHIVMLFLRECAG